MAEQKTNNEVVNVSSEITSDLIDRFVDFLDGAAKKGGAFKKGDSHVIFKCGTVARFDLDDTKFSGFYSDEYEFPEHRVKNPAVMDALIDNNQKRFDSLISKYPQLTQAIHNAYSKLINDGYPYPGGEGADRMAIPIEENYGFVYFITRDKYVFNLIVPSMVSANTELSEHEMAGMGGEMRRYDYMEPVPIAFISSDLEVTQLIS